MWSVVDGNIIMWCMTGDAVQGLNRILRNMLYCCNLTKFMIITNNTLQLFKIMDVDGGGRTMTNGVTTPGS